MAWTPGDVSASQTLTDADHLYAAHVNELRVAADAKQPLDSDLTAIAAISPSNDDVIQRKAGSWTNRTPAQLKSDLALAKGDVGLGNVDNTSDASKPVSTATQTALDLKANLASPTFTGNLTVPTVKITGGSPGVGKVLTSDADGDATWTTAGAGDMVLASTQTVTGAKTFNAGTLLDKGSEVFNVKAYGAVGDGKTVTDGIATASSTSFTSATAAFTSADTGKLISINGAGASGATLNTTITYVNATTVTLGVAASTSVNPATFFYGTNDTSALQAAVDAANTAGGGVVYVPKGTYAVNSAVGGSTVGQYSNISIVGAGRNVSILKAAAYIAVINFGTGDATGGNTWKNLRFAHFTIDMNNQNSGGSYGMTLGCCQDVEIDDIHIKNQKNGANAMLFFGVSSGASSSMIARNLVVTNSIFSDSDANWEGITLAQAYNCKFVNCVFRDKTAIYMFLNYGSYNVSVVSCDFYSCGNAVNGKGNTEFVGCNFFKAQVKVQADNTTFSACSFRSTGATYNGYIQFIGYKAPGSETFWDTPANEIRVLKNNKVIGCTFEQCNVSAVFSATWADGATRYADCDDLLIDGCNFINTYWRGIDVMANYLTVQNCKSVNSNQANSGSVAHNYATSGGTIKFINNISLDDRGTPLVNYDSLVDRQSSTTAVWATTDIYYRDNYFTRNGGFVCWDGSSFVTTPPSGLNVYTYNNVGLTYSNHNMFSKKIVSLADPASAQDAATKNYVDTNFVDLTTNQTVSPSTKTFGTNTSASAPRLKVVGYSDTIPLQEWGDGTGSVYTRIGRSVGNQMSMDNANYGSQAFLFSGYYAFGNTTNAVAIGKSSLATSSLDIAGPIATALATKTANYTLTATDSVILSNSASALTHTLPTAVGITGRQYTIKNINTGVVTVATTSSQTIDGATSKTLSNQYDSVSVVSDGANWTSVVLPSTYYSGGTDVAVADGGTGASTATAAFNALDPLTTKGDIIVNDGTNSVRLPVGSNNQVLTADSGQTTGVKWASAAAVSQTPDYVSIMAFMGS